MVFLSLTILIITIPHFFINKKFAATGLRHKIGYENVMNISITDTFNSIFLISIFLLTFSLFSYILLKTKILEKTIKSFSSSSRFENLIPKYKGIKSKLKKNKLVSDFSLRLKKNPSIIYIIYFFFLLFYAFTYLNNLGITGVQPYRLPFKLSGIIFYLKIFIIPFFSLILYFFSKRSLSNSLLIIIFSILISLFTLSKTPGFIVILPSLLLNLENKKYYKSSILFIAMASIFKLTSILRLNSFYDLNGINQVDTSISLVVNSLNKFLFSDSIIISIWRSIKGIIYRFDSFQNFLLALSYDSSKTYGIKGFLTMLIYKPFVIINDIDLHNMEWLGITYSKGLATRGGLLSHYLITFNGGIT